MKLHSILPSKTIRFMRGSYPMGSVYMPDVVNLMQKHFHFFQVPTKLEDFDAAKGIKFLHGTFEGTVIDLFEIYDNGILVTTRANTDHSEKFMDAVIKMATKELKFSVEEIPHMTKTYTSDLEIILEKDISSFFEPFKKAFKLVNKHLSQQADDIPPFEGSGIVFDCDTKTTYLKPTRFILDRRAGQPFESNLYYSSAPLSTNDHLEVLEELEKNI